MAPVLLSLNLDYSTNRSFYLSNDEKYLYMKNFHNLLEKIDLIKLHEDISNHRKNGGLFPLKNFTGSCWSGKILDFTIWNEEFAICAEEKTNILRKIRIKDWSVVKNSLFEKYGAGICSISNCCSNYLTIATFNKSVKINVIYLLNNDLSWVGSEIDLKDQSDQIHNLFIKIVGRISIVIAINYQQVVHLFAIRDWVQKLQQEEGINSFSSGKDTSKKVYLQSIKQNITVTKTSTSRILGYTILQEKDNVVEMLLFGDQTMNKRVTLKVPEIN